MQVATIEMSHYQDIVNNS